MSRRTPRCPRRWRPGRSRFTASGPSRAGSPAEVVIVRNHKNRLSNQARPCAHRRGGRSHSEQENSMMKVEPQQEHQWLQKLVGEWTFEADAVMGPDKPPEKFKGAESVRSIGGLWMACEGRGEMPGGGTATTVMTLGYDPAKKRYVGTFIGSMMTHMWVYEGELDPSGKVLTLDTEGPNFGPGGGTAKYKDVIEFKSDDHRVLTSHMLGADGQWHGFMTAHYRRTK